jgi:hypothetical protein
MAVPGAQLAAPGAEPWPDDRMEGMGEERGRERWERRAYHGMTDDSLEKERRARWRGENGLGFEGVVGEMSGEEWGLGVGGSVNVRVVCVRACQRETVHRACGGG